MDFSVPKLLSVDGYSPNCLQIIFHGVNKSGSLALSRAIRNAYEFHGRDDEVFGHYFLGGSTSDYIAKIESRDLPGFYVGHYLYGALADKDNRIFFSQFRHPLPRVLSCFTWLKMKSERLHPDKPFPELDAWVRETRGIQHSQICQFGAGFAPGSRSLVGTMSKDEMLERSIEVIETELISFGIAEYFEESIYLLASLCGLPSVQPWQTDNRSPNRTPWPDIPISSRELIEDTFKFDFMLYEYALNKFKKNIENLEFGPDFKLYKYVCHSQYKDRILADGEDECDIQLDSMSAARLAKKLSINYYHDKETTAKLEHALSRETNRCDDLNRQLDHARRYPWKYFKTAWNERRSRKSN